jgi:hypothetical protein
MADNAYKAYDLTLSTGEGSPPVLLATIGSTGSAWSITGTCDIGFINNYGTIYAGTFSGASFINKYGTIYAGTFSGDGFVNNTTTYGGTFSGDGFVNNTTTNGGTFSGAGFINNGSINAGTFSGDAASYYKTGNSITATTPNGIGVQITLPQLDILGTGLA